MGAVGFKNARYLSHGGHALRSCGDHGASMTVLIGGEQGRAVETCRREGISVACGIWDQWELLGSETEPASSGDIVSEI